MGQRSFSGLKAPTGVTDDRDTSGERFETEHQPGSGSWDTLAGLALSRRIDSVSLHANILYIFATKGALDTDLGDGFHYNAAASYRMTGMNTALDLVLELNGEWKEKQTIAGSKDNDSGGNILYLAPGLRISPAQKWTAYFSVGLPIVQDLNGIQNDIDYKVLGGVGTSF